MDTAPFPNNEAVDVPQMDYTAAISQALGSFIQSKSATFACGGSVPIVSKDASSTTVPSGSTSSAPVALRWDSRDFAAGTTKLSFPLDANAAPSTILVKLVSDCQPASFGLNGADVLDESYRKATKLDRAAFSVNFCPYEVGIIDTIAQLLLPGTEHGTKGVRAELYKLNIYAAPSGFFKAHVDTPRSPMQFGSLVVSLPCHHVGGQLVVRHAGLSKTFDWGTTTALNPTSSQIQWAAFYSDCEHEVLQVTEGHRITLTYNLYHTPGVGDLAGMKTAMDVTSLPLFQYGKDALKTPGFMPQGGNLGIYCQHAYAHADYEAAKELPGTLKGSDMAVYDVFRALGLRVKVYAILAGDNNDGYEDYEDEDEDEDEGDLRCSILGELCGLQVTEEGGYDGSTLREITDAWGGQHVNVTWANEPQHLGPGLVHLTYGNQAGVDTMYSSAAIIVQIPSAGIRGAAGTQSEPITVD
ncbi:hypothetical protein CC86DRAFT_41658 [Ophiobolus disseminans]|uniref:Fe2OG dioxygenase domain-containing protein n=1 Tax=Ophiobolus disseminans TaxID=1469910 RepID=A0A6A6ZXL6_9PLEO|nr:hypothetical protein CC86DRAFT_41658 [Ophiobolus disseminans]